MKGLRNSTWQPTKTARARPSVGTCPRFSSPRCPSTGWFSTKLPKRPFARPPQPAADRQQPGPRTGGAADHRSALRLQRFAAVVAENPAAAVGRPRAKRCRAADCRARAAADGVPDGHLLGPAGKFANRAGAGFQAEMASFEGRRIPEGATSTGHRPAEGSEPVAAGRGPDHPTCPATANRPVAGRQPGRQALYHAALSALHHQHAAAGGQPQVRLHRPPHHAGGPKPLRERPHHLHADRLDHAGLGGGRGGPANW